MLTTVCYMEKDQQYLMLYRNKKKIDINKGKWIGVGGKLEKNESPLACIKREVREETGYIIEACKERGLVVFNYNNNASEYMYIYTSDKFSGQELAQCKEGELKWIDKNKVFDLNLWEGDRIFLKLIQEDSPYFFLTLNYCDDKLISHQLKFKKGISVENFRDKDILRGDYY